MTACAAEKPLDDDGLIQTAASARFDELFQRTRSIVPQQDADHPIVRITSIDFDRDGAFLIADGAEGDVKLFNAAGRRLTVIGRQGRGPGEFNQLVAAVFAHDGRIIAADAGNRRISSFDRSGSLIEEIDISSYEGLLTGFDVLPDGRMIAAFAPLEASPQRPRHLIYILDPNGRVVSRHIQSGGLRPTGTGPSQYWTYFQHVFFGRSDDSLFVVSPASDTLWTVDTAGMNVRGRRFMFDGYEGIQPPSDDSRSFREWLESGQKAYPPLAGGDLVVIPFVKGVLNYGDPTVYLVRTSDRGWLTLPGGPPLIHAERDYFVAIENPLQDPVILGIYRTRS